MTSGDHRRRLGRVPATLLSKDFSMPGTRWEAWEPAPWFESRTASNPRFRFEGAAGRYVVLCFFGSAGDPTRRAILDQVQRRRDIFNDYTASFFGVSVDPEDEASGRACDAVPGVRIIWDFDRAVS